MRATVLGAGGFVGRRLTERLRDAGFEVETPGRDLAAALQRPLGHLFYCIGLTSDFRSRPFDTMRAHVGVVTEVLEHGDFDSLLYLSSTRVYAGAASAGETQTLPIAPLDPSDLYNVSKLAGEAICLHAGLPNVRVARLSNVTGHDPDSPTFLAAVIREALAGHIELQTDLASWKDYILLDDVCDLLIAIATSGRETIYNVASGVDLTHGEIAEALAALTGCTVAVRPGAPLSRFPTIDVARIRAEFGFTAAGVVAELPALIAAARADALRA